MAVRLPRLLDSSMQELARLNPVSLSLDENLSPLSTAEMVLPEGECAAETGQLVLATLHTQDVASSVNRILDVLSHNQQQVRSQLAESLAVVASQRLLPRADGQGRVAAFEVLVATEAVRHLIREGQTHQLQSYLQTVAKAGMVTMEESVKNLRRKGLIK